jgi:hypothetical protein
MVYNVVLMKNDTIVSVIICYDFYHNDFDVFCSLMKMFVYDLCSIR